MEPDVIRELDRINRTLEGITGPSGSLAKIWESIGKIGSHCETVCEKKFISSQEFAPVKALAFGFAALVLCGFIGGLVALIFKTKVLP